MTGKVICNAAGDGRCEGVYGRLCHAKPHTREESCARDACPYVIGPVECIPVEESHGVDM